MEGHSGNDQDTTSTNSQGDSELKTAAVPNEFLEIEAGDGEYHLSYSFKNFFSRNPAASPEVE